MVREKFGWKNREARSDCIRFLLDSSKLATIIYMQSTECNILDVDFFRYSIPNKEI